MINQPTAAVISGAGDTPMIQVNASGERPYNFSQQSTGACNSLLDINKIVGVEIIATDQGNRTTLIYAASTDTSA